MDKGIYDYDDNVTPEEKVKLQDETPNKPENDIENSSKDERV